MADAQFVEVKPALESKINWTAFLTSAIGLGSALAAALGAPISDEVKVQIMELCLIIGPPLIIYLRTYRTNTITPSSAKL